MPVLVRIFVVCCSIWALAGPSYAEETQSVSTPERRVYATAPETTWARSGMISFQALLKQLSAADVVFLGENHDDPNTHILQAELLEQLHALRNGQVALSMEQFERDVQSALDAYLSGTMDESAFLAASRPWPNYDPDYRRLVEFCKANGVPVCAANIPRPLASRVAKQGFDAAWMGYTAEERQWIADHTSAPKDTYYDLFTQVMAGGSDAHGGGMQMPAEMLYSVYQAQCIKDDTMAESIARLRSAAPERLVIHTNGSFHSDYRLGTVMRVVERRSPPAFPSADKVLVVAIRPVNSWSEATVHAEDLPLPAGADGAMAVADFIVYVPGPDFGKQHPVIAPTPDTTMADEEVDNGQQPPMPPAMPSPPAVKTS